MHNHDLILDIASTPVANPLAKVVLLALAKYSNAQGQCFPSKERLSQDSFIPTRTLIRHLQWLESHGFIRINERLGTSNFYVITSMEEDMSDDTRANLAHEVVSNITQLDIGKKSNSNLTTSHANLAHPHDTPFFLAFWQAYPRRLGKGAARTAFNKATKLVDGAFIVNAAASYARYCEAIGTEKQYIPHPSTWLNQERWDDDLESEQQATEKNHDWVNNL